MFWKKKKPKYQTPQVTGKNFIEVIKSSKGPILLDFYADWCGPCKVLGPIINELSQEYEGRAYIAKVNTEINPALSQHFRVQSIPTIIVINKGEIVERFQGLVPKPNLEEILDQYIEANLKGES